MDNHGIEKLVRIIYKSFKLTGQEVANHSYIDYVTSQLLERAKVGKVELSLDFLRRFSMINNEIVEADKKTWIDREKLKNVKDNWNDFSDFFSENFVTLPTLPDYVYKPQEEIDIYIQIISFFLFEYCKGGKFIREYNDQVAINLLEYINSTHILDKELKKSEISTRIAGNISVSSEFELEVMKATYTKTYPNMHWFLPPPVSADSGKADMIFGILPYKAAKIENKEDTQKEKTDYTKIPKLEDFIKIPIYAEGEEEFEDDKELVIEQLEVDYDKLEQTLLECNNLIKKGGFLSICSLVHESGDEDYELIDYDTYKRTWISKFDIPRFLHILNKTGWSLILVGNQFTDFFILKKPVHDEKVNSFVYLKDIETVKSEGMLSEILESCHKQKDYSGIVYIIDKSFLTADSFDEMLSFKYDQDLIRAKERQHFRKIYGKDCIESTEYYDVISDLPWEENNSNVIYLPINNKLFPQIEVCYSVPEICKKFCDTNVAFKELKMDGIPWFDYCQKHEPKWFKEVNILEKAQLDKWDDCRDNWQYSFGEILEGGFAEELRCQNLITMDYPYPYDGPPEPVSKNSLSFLFGQHDLMIRLSGVDGIDKFHGNEKNKPYSLAWQIYRNQYEMGYSRTQLLVSQIIRANIVRVILNSNIIWVEYLKLFFDSTSGKRILSQWKKSTEGSPLSNFEELTFFFPDMYRQKELVSSYKIFEKNLNICQREQEECKKGQKSILSHIGSKSPIYDNPSDLSKKMVRSYTESQFLDLPQPLATILYLDACESNNARKCNHLLHFFEAVSIFHAMILASVLLALLKEKRDEKLIEELITVIKKRLKPGNKTFESEEDFFQSAMITFGQWIGLLKDMIGSFSELLETVFLHEKNAELLELLDKCLVVRNSSAHGPNLTVIMESDKYSYCSELASKIRQLLAQIYDGIEFLFDCVTHSTKSDNEVELKGYRVFGANPRLQYIIQVIRKQDLEEQNVKQHCLYAKLQNGRFIWLLPFVNYYALTEKDPSLLSAYYLNQIVVAQKNKRKSYTKWNSFDCGDIECRVMKFDESIDTKRLLKLID